MVGTAYGIREVEVSGKQDTLAIYGSGDRPGLSELGDQLTASLDLPVNVKLVIVPSLQEIFVADGECWSETMGCCRCTRQRSI